MSPRVDVLSGSPVFISLSNAVHSLSFSFNGFERTAYLVLTRRDSVDYKARKIFLITNTTQTSEKEHNMSV